MSVGHLFGHLLGRKVKLEYLFVSDIREKNWSPFDLVEWLKESNFHFILTHPHQGNPRWDCSDVYTALEDLEDHSGFPHKQSFHCPIFSQHKFRYLTAVSEIVNPTLAIPFPKVRRQFDKLGNIRYESYANSDTFNTPDLSAFLRKYNEGYGWVVKFPFVTVREGIKFCKKESDVLKALDISAGKFGGRIPYAMLQPCLANRKEYKVVVLNGKASHMLPQDAGVRLGSKAARSFSSYPHTDLFHFAEFAVDVLARRCRGSQVDGLVRVDIMQTLDGNMIVNEFESLEALYMSRSEVVTFDTVMFLKEHWAKVVRDVIETK